MRHIYESFEELADCMCEGTGILHSMNCPHGTERASNEPCLNWQAGVRDFAGWLDHIGITINISDKANDFYTYMSRRKVSQNTIGVK